MKNSLNNIFNKATALVMVLVALGLFYGCEYELPGPNSKPDDTPPEAAFSYASDPEDFKVTNFTNLSTEALTFLWDFGGGNTSTEKDPTFTFDAEGEYDVTLVSTDGLGVSSSSTQKVMVTPGPYQPIILEAGFEDGTLEGGAGDGRASWESEFSTVIQISGSPVVSGSQAGKLPNDGARVAYQEIVVEAETNYDVSFIYTLTDGVPGTLAVEILDIDANGGTFMTYEETRAYVIGSITLNDQDDPSTYTGGQVSFASGTSTKVAIMVSNSEGIEARFDDFAIQIGSSGGIPPAVSFDINQDADNYLLYSFVNTTLNGASYLWDFGDGETSTEESPIHEYAEADVYTVTLSAKSEGGVSASFDQTFVLHDQVTAGFDYTIDGFTVHLTDTSINAAMVNWEFGDGFGANLDDPSHTYSVPGYYTITQVATSSTGLESEASVTLALGLPEVFNGAFEDGTSSWKIGSFTGGNTNAFNGSSDGDFEFYDGTPSEDKTKGAKYTSSTSANADGSLVPNSDPLENSKTRMAYQAMTLDPNTEYYLEYSYSLHIDNAAGSKVVGQILDGHYDDGADALLATKLVTVEGTVIEGKGNFNKVNAKFTTGPSGEVAIWLWANGTKDTWFDNVKILPAWLVEG